VSRTQLVPELGIAAGAIAVTTALHWFIVIRLGENPLFLFAVTAAAVTFWRGLGPGMLASSLGSAIGSSLYSAPINQIGRHQGNIPVETVLLFAGSMFTCWLIYRLRVDQEDTRLQQDRRNNALAFVSHELRQPLSNVVLAADLLDRDPSDQSRIHVTNLIKRSAGRLESIIDDLVDVTRMDGGAITVDLAVMSLQESIIRAIDDARPEIERKQQTIHVDVPAAPPLWIRGDAKRLEQVFGNVLSNASKYSPDGAEISVSCRDGFGRAAVVVRDTGLGIARDRLQAIFEPFVRETANAASGLGIGLTLARTLAAEHGGRISAHSEGPGRGSTFVIDLPLTGDPHSRRPI
jgi:signal transduction histidine kinase